jgi:hypothetical protein
MMLEVRRRVRPDGVRVWLLAAAALVAGCKSDLNQQLLERELRFQEDQIYELQDELHEKCARLERAAQENVSLRRQLGVGDNDPAVAPRTSPVRPRPATAVPGLVPPAIEAPDLPRSAAPPAVPLAPPALDGVPPLPDRSEAAPADDGSLPVLPVSEVEPPLALPPPAAMKTDPAARPAAVALPMDDVRRLSFDASVPTHVVVTASRTACLDADGDGTSEGLKVVFEPRDAEERLAAAAGDVEVAAFDAAGGGPIGAWRITAAEAAGSFRPTGRDRGLSFTLPWQAAPPAGDHVRVAVRFAVPGAEPLEADATIRVR